MSHPNDEVRVVVVSTRDLENTVNQAVSRALHGFEFGTPKHPTYLTANEVATFMRVRRTTVLAALKDGTLPGQREGGRRWRIRYEDAKAWADTIGQPTPTDQEKAEGEQ